MESKLEVDTKDLYSKYIQLPPDAKARVNRLMNDQDAYFHAVQREHKKLVPAQHNQYAEPAAADELSAFGYAAAALLTIAYLL